MPRNSKERKETEEKKDEEMQKITPSIQRRKQP
jgi:hypothetical protein